MSYLFGGQTTRMGMKHVLIKQAARLGLFLSAAVALLASSPVAHAAAGNNNLKIIAWYGAGNLNKSQYARDTVILFNPTQQTITMSNWSLQTGNSSGTFSTVYKLPNVSIPAGGFYAIAGSGIKYISSSGCTSSTCNLNYAYDYQLKTLEGKATDTDNDLSSTAVNVALVSNQTLLSGSCPTTASAVVDYIGIGAVDGSSAPSCFAGSSYAPYTPSSLNGSTTNINGLVYPYATVRKNKCTDTFDNYNDFMLGYIVFANSNSAPQTCPTGKQLAVTASATPSNPGVLENFTITATVTPATVPSSANLNVTADLSNLGLSATTQLYDDGTHGDSKAGDNVYSLTTAATTGSVGLVPGLIVSASDLQGNTAATDLSLTLAQGTFSMTTATTNGTVSAGGVLTFPITLTGLHGYGGTLAMTCTGSPNTNSLGVPISTQCVSTPPQITLDNNGTASISLAIATGTTHSASIVAPHIPLTALGLLSLGILTVGVWRRKHLPVVLLMALLTCITLSTTACGTNAGIGNTSASPGTYTYTLTATDATTSTITNSLTFNILVQ